MEIITGDLVPDRRSMMDTFVLHTQCTHTNDTESSHRTRFGDTQSLQQYWGFLSNFKDKPFTDAEVLTKLVKQAAVDVGLKESEGVDVFRSIIPHDNGQLGSHAVLSTMYVRYWDDVGHEHYVDVVENDDH